MARAERNETKRDREKCFTPIGFLFVCVSYHFDLLVLCTVDAELQNCINSLFYHVRCDFAGRRSAQPLIVHFIIDRSRMFRLLLLSKEPGDETEFIVADKQNRYGFKSSNFQIF